MKKLTTEEFIARSRVIHGDKYDYSLVEYKGSNKKVKIICPEHGVFEQTPHNHLDGGGCRKCGGNAPLDTETFIAKAKAVHGDKYDYSKVVYKNNRTKVKIICPEHGVFEQQPNHHLQGKDCAECIFSAEQWYIYIATDTPFPGRFKIGCTGNPQERLATLHSKTPFEVVFLAVFKMGKLKRREVERIEKGLHNIFKTANCNYPGLRNGGFDSATEWFFFRPGDIRPEKVVSMIARLVNAASYRNYFHK
ncbi:GIY-YIG nuclease family protein [Shigella sonnei]|nr:GIY-YIG nuclease family protein [Shigella sonnei]